MLAIVKIAGQQFKVKAGDSLYVPHIEGKAGDTVEIFGKHISIQEVAKAADTIAYEIMTGISLRVKRVYIEE